MKPTFLRSTLAALACGAALAFASPSIAATVTLKADLKASSEVPPNDSKDTCSLTVTYDDASKKLSWKGSTSGLSGPATAAHFHDPAGPGVNAGLVVPISGADKGAFEDSATLTDAQATEMLVTLAPNFGAIVDKCVKTDGV